MKGLRGRVLFLAIILGIEGIMLSLFSGMNELTLGIIFLIGFSLTVQMAEGATFSVVPFINKKAIGSISGIVGAGGNVGAFVAAFVLKSKSAVAEKKAIADNQNFSQEAIQAAQTFASSEAVSSGYFTIGIFVIFTAVISLMIKFSTEDEKAVAREMKSTPVYS